RSRKADVIEEVLRQLSLAAADYSRVLMIGDRLHDINGAKAHGLHSAGVKYGYAQEGELEKAGADYVFETVEQLDLFLQK
ncbi:MAG: HAD hydrolase-like protein, partial [Oscillospiraceae bacterium]|nr:HAD hydrolase-like protein [Oscillospiraceae bacterium]